MNEMIFEITKTINNMKKNDYTVGDYKVCKTESELCIKALELLKKSLEFDNIKPIGAEDETSI